MANKFFSRCIIIFLSTVSYAWGLEATLFAEGGYGNLHGFAQIPKGGDFNTTSENRPSFKEVETSDDDFFHGLFELSQNAFVTYLDYYRFRPRGKAPLSDSLLSHSQFIPKGETLNMSVHYNWYEVGVGWTFVSSSGKWALTPTLGVDWFKFLYAYASPLAHSHRGFNLLASSLGLNLHHRMDSNLSWELSGSYSLPISELELGTLLLGLNYTYPINLHLQLRPKVSVGMVFMDYEDSQTIPNHFQYHLLPYASLGMSILIS